METGTHRFILNKSGDMRNKHTIENLLRIVSSTGVVRLKEIEGLSYRSTIRVNKPVNHVQVEPTGFLARNRKAPFPQSNICPPHTNITQFYGGFDVPEIFGHARKFHSQCFYFNPSAFLISHSPVLFVHGVSLPLHQISLQFDCIQRFLSDNPLTAHFNHLCLDKQNGANADYNATESNECQSDVHPKSGAIITILAGGRDDPYIGIDVCLGFGLEVWAGILFWNNGWRCWRNWIIALGCLMCFVRLGVSLHREDVERQCEERQYFQHNSINVSQKRLTQSKSRNPN